MSPTTNSPILGMVMDVLLGLSLMTNDRVTIPYKKAMNLLSCNPLFVDLIKKDKKEWKAREIISTFLPNINLLKSSKLKNDQKINKNVIINNGKLISGVLDKNTMGKGSEGIIHTTFKEYGSEATRDFLNIIEKTTNLWLQTNGFSVGVSDIVVGDKINNEIKNQMSSKIENVKDKIKSVEKKLLKPQLGKTVEEQLEWDIKILLNEATSEAGDKVTTALSSDINNSLRAMVISGSKGSPINISQITAVVGQQDVNGNRVPKSYGKRTLPHFHKFDDSAESRGFVKNNYFTGLEPSEFFFHAMSGRVGLIDTAIKTATSGYISRRLVKVMEDIMVYYDNTVRNSIGQIIQFIYGDDGIDAIMVEKQKFETIDMNNEEIKKKYLFTKEDFKELKIKSKNKNLYKELIEDDKIFQNEYDQRIKDRDMLRHTIFTRKNDTDTNPISINLTRIITNAQFIDKNDIKNNIIDPRIIIKMVDEL